MFANLLDRIGDWNPQLFRELKGRLKSRNAAIAVGISAIGQILTYLLFLTKYPGRYDDFHRYCIGQVPANWNGGYDPYNLSKSQFCLRDGAGFLQPQVFNHELWWLDLFTTLSFISIFALLVVGVYMLIADLSREERRGTIGFIRLSPQSTRNILMGKMLGVPALLYVAIAAMLPLHLWSAIAASLDISRVFSFYLVVAASCAFFYSAALLYGLVSASLGNFQAWVGSGTILMFVSFFSFRLLDSHEIPTFSLADLFLLLHPGSFLPYVVSSAPHSLDIIGYLHVKEFAQLSWFELPIFHHSKTAIAFILANYAVGTYWIWQGLQRRFHNARATVISKRQSYFLSGSLVVAMMGFAVQDLAYSDSTESLFINFNVLYVFLLLIGLGLTACLSPHRQTLQDWARYRHQTSTEARSLWRDLVWGEQSPATLAIALNLVVTGSTILVAILMLPFREYRLASFLGLICTASIIVVYASIVQWILLMKSNKRGVWATAAIAAATFLPMLCFILFQIDPMGDSLYRGLWLLSATPAFVTEAIAVSTVGWTILSEWLAIALINIQLSRQLQRAGESATKALLEGRDRPYVMN
jgi:hypothetical protein